MRKLLFLLLVFTTTIAITGCGAPTETATTQTSEVVVLDDDVGPVRSTDPFDNEYVVDGEPALRVRGDVAAPRRVKLAEPRTYSFTGRNICFPMASVVVVIDKMGKVREVELISFENAQERIKGQPLKELSFDETLALLDEMVPGIHEWEYLPASVNGDPVPVKVQGGWRMKCR